MLPIFIFFLFWTLVHSLDTTCPTIPFSSVLNSQCPAFQDLRCVRFMTRSKVGPHTINCALSKFERPNAGNFSFSGAKQKPGTENSQCNRIGQRSARNRSVWPANLLCGHVLCA